MTKALVDSCASILTSRLLLLRVFVFAVLASEAIESLTPCNTLTKSSAFEYFK